MSKALWTVQALLFVTFTGTGSWKILTPIPKLATMIPWAGEVSLFVFWGRRFKAPIS
jgi:hypothetical protein